MLLPGYDVAKAAQAVAYFALLDGGKINVLKLAKLLYLAEREFIHRYDEPMFFDQLVSMPDGPVTSVTYNFINGEIDDPAWPKFVAPRKGYDVCVQSGIDLGDLDELSPAEIEVLDSLWDRFGHFNRYALRDWTHVKTNVPEWEDPGGSSYIIPYKKIFDALGKPDPKALERQINERRALSKALIAVK